MLLSEFIAGKIDRINLTNSASPLSSLQPGTNPEGTAYDNAGNLFANLGTRSGTALTKFVAKISPVTGAILGQTPNLSSLDGLAYDPFSNMLFAASLFGPPGGPGGTVYQVDPTNLSNVVDIVQSFSGSIKAILGADGIASNGQGHIFVASAPGGGGDGHIYDINLITHTITQGDFISAGLDDLAPASGLGAPQGELFPALGCCGEKPHFEDPAYSSVFTGQVAVATCFASSGADGVLVVEDLKNQATAPLNSNYAPPIYHGPGASWTRDNLGDIFGATLDDSGNIYVTATTAYGLDIYPTGKTAMDIYQINGGTGAITLFKALPQSPTTGNGAGLGNIAYDCTSSELLCEQHRRWPHLSAGSRR